jgi:hypothetical protein
MISLIPQHDFDARPEPYAEAVSRLASVRHALRLVDGGFSAGPEGDLDADVAAVWDDAGEAKQRWFDRRSASLVGTAAAGIEALLGQRQQGREPHVLACKPHADEIRREPPHVAGIDLSYCWGSSGPSCSCPLRPTL